MKNIYIEHEIDLDTLTNNINHEDIKDFILLLDKKAEDFDLTIDIIKELLKSLHVKKSILNQIFKLLNKEINLND